MNQLTLPIVNQESIPSDIMDAFVLCNTAPRGWEYKQCFYSLAKEPMLRLHGQRAGFDLQIIEKKCWECAGTGTDYHCTDKCGYCYGSGIYETKKIVLERYILNGRVFHQPTKLLWSKVGLFDNILNGLVVHNSEVNSPDAHFFSVLMFLWGHGTISACMSAIRNWNMVNKTKAGKETNFVPKLWASLPNYYTLYDFLSWNKKGIESGKLSEAALLALYAEWSTIDVRPKFHTIRAKGAKTVIAGDTVSFYIWSARPYCSAQIVVSPIIEVKRVWDFDLVKDDGGGTVIFVNGIVRKLDMLLDISKNDGLELVDFLLWFKHPKQTFVNGSIICWSDKVKY